MALKYNDKTGEFEGVENTVLQQHKKNEVERITRENEERRRRAEAERAERARREREWEQRKREEERIKKEQEEEEKRIWLIILGIGSFILSIFLPFIGLPIFFYIVFKYF